VVVVVVGLQRRNTRRPPPLNVLVMVTHCNYTPA
jgi:hypothetical protein